MIHHIEIYVSDLMQSREFYDFFLTELNFTLYQDWAQGFSYRSQGFYLVFVQAEAPFLNNGYHRKNIGLNHLAFSLPTKEAIDAFRKKMLAKAVPELYAPAYPYAAGQDHYAFFCEDPNRIKLEVVWEK